MLDKIVPSSVSLKIADDEMWDKSLSEQEESYLINSVEKRKREFRAGRNAAKEALKQIGCTGEIVIPVGEMRQPVWPNGFTGSISHTNNYCAAVIARRRDYLSIGIDVEASSPLEPDLHKLICTKTERDWLKSQVKPAELAKLIFCIKEAIFKAYYPIYSVFFEFQDAEVFINLSTNEFKADIRQVESMPAFHCGGRFSIGGDIVCAFLGVENSQGKES